MISSRYLGAGLSLTLLATAAATGAETATGINRAIDCAHYPSGEAGQYHEQFEASCRETARMMGFRDGALLPRDTAAKEVALTGNLPSWCAEEPGTDQFYCVGLDQQGE